MGHTLQVIISASLFVSSLSFSQENSSSFETGKSLFESYRQEKVAEIKSLTGGYRLPSAPYALIHPYRTKYSALLIHGLNDSPYYLKDIARTLFARGFNVVTILLPGHGLNFLEMDKVSYRDWINEVRIGTEIAAMLGENVTVGGFSTGGLLSINAALDSESIKGLFLFAPAIKIKTALNLGNRISFLSCLYQSANYSRISENPVKYNRLSNNGICQLSKLVAYVYNKVGSNIISSFKDEAVVKIARKIVVPTFVVNTLTDERLDSKAITKFENGLAGAHTNLTFDGIPHSYLVLKSNSYNMQYNPDFDRIEAHLSEFLNQHFH